MSKLLDFLKKRIENGTYAIIGDEIIFFPEDSDKYIYDVGDKFRVMIPNPSNPKKKHHIGYFPTKKMARKMRNHVLREINKIALEKIIKSEKI